MPPEMQEMIRDGLIMYVCLLFALSVHEAAHAWVADLRGDDTARHLGRITLNPIPHIDPFGTVIMPIVMLILPFPLLFGWAKPVPFNPLRLKNMRLDPVWIALAGPASNVLLGVLAAVLLKIALLVAGPAIPEPIVELVFYLVLINAILFLFNLIPVPPLDGHHVLNYFLPPKGQEVMASIGPFGILIALIIAQYALDAPLVFLINLFYTFIIG